MQPIVLIILESCTVLMTSIWFLLRILYICDATFNETELTQLPMLGCNSTVLPKIIYLQCPQYNKINDITHKLGLGIGRMHGDNIGTILAKYIYLAFYDKLLV